MYSLTLESDVAELGPQAQSLSEGCNPIVGLGCSSVGRSMSKLTHMQLTGLRSLLAIGQKYQLLATWASPKIVYNAVADVPRCE